MVDELRVLTFNMTEVEHALLEFAEASERNLPKARVTQVLLVRDRIAQVTLTRDNEARATLLYEGKDEKASFNEYEIAAALLRYCAKQNIPVPKRGQKTVSVVDGTVRLSVALRS